MSYLNIKNVEKSFSGKKVLENINLEIEKGEFLCLLGPSGCGKTTLLRIIAGLEDLDNGGIFLSSDDITYLSPDKRGFGIVFQSYALFPNMSAYKNIAFALEQKKLKKDEIDAKVKEVLEVVGISEHCDKYPRELSGGQQQRVAIARAIALEPKFLLLDEPMSALDAKVRTKLRYDIKSLQKRLKITTIMVTHDQEEAITMADRIAVLNDGKVMQVGSPQEIYQRPSNLFTAMFIGDTNCIKNGADIYTIRPEYVSIAKDFKGMKRGVISNVEFRGSMARVYISPDNNMYGEVIFCDISIKEFSNLGLTDGQRVSFEFDDSYYIRYEASKGA